MIFQVPWIRGTSTCAPAINDVAAHAATSRSRRQEPMTSSLAASLVLNEAASHAGEQREGPGTLGM